MAGYFKDKAVVITGAAGGIGREVALAFAGEGAQIVVVDPGLARDGTGGAIQAADEVVETIRTRGGTAICCRESVADFAGAERVVKTCVDEFGHLDILFNGAGVLRERMIYNMTEDDFDTVISVHLKGTFNMCRHATAVMKEQKGGRIINVTSDAWRGTVGQSNYGAAKAGIVGLTRAIAREMGRLGVTCNALCPLAATRMTVNEAVKEGMKKRLEAGLITQERYDNYVSMPGPEYIPPAALFLASEAVADLNGQVVGIRGGQIYLFSEPVPVKVLHKDIRTYGAWRLDELMETAPGVLMAGYVNPAPRESK